MDAHAVIRLGFKIQNTKLTIKKDKKILLIGPVTNLSKGMIGGATISFGYLIEYLENNGRNYRLIDTQKFAFGTFSFLSPIIVLFQILISVPFTDVVFLNSSRNGTRFLAPLSFVLTRLFTNKFVFRPFGGNISSYVSKYNRLEKWIFNHTVAKADLLFLQTKSLMEYFSTQAKYTVQLVTSRPKPLIDKPRQSSYKKKFIYLGNVIKEKGIFTICDAMERLDINYTIDIYGPINDRACESKIANSKGSYKGLIRKEEVSSLLSNYDVLVLPTYYEGEGYPGVIIEAYSMGLPVITTHWRSIPEIVEDKVTGILIEPRSVDELVEAIQSFTRENYSDYANNAQSYFYDNFEVTKVTEKAIKEIDNLF